MSGHRHLGALAILLLCGCAIKLPDDFKRYAPSVHAHNLAIHLASKQVLFLEGSYPEKTYLGRIDTESGKTQKWRFTGHGLKSFILDGAGEHAFVEALLASNTGPSASAILSIKLPDGKLEWETNLPAGSSLVNMGLTQEADELIAVLQAGSDVVYKSLNLAKHSFSEAHTIGRFKAGEVSFLSDHRQFLIATAPDEPPSLIIVSLPEGTARSFKAPSRVTGLRPLADGRAIGVHQIPGDERGAIEIFDPKTLSQETVATIDGEVESVIINQTRAYVIAKDFKRPRDREREWLHPRNVATITLENREVLESVPWTQRSGHFLTPGPSGDSVFFSIDDHDAPAVWSIPLTEAALRQAGAALDQKPSPFASIGLGAVAGIIGLLISGLLGALYFKTFWDFMSRQLY